MPDNKIEYSLGLSTNDFLGALSKAACGLAGLAGACGVTVSAGAAFAGILQQIEKGAALNDLSKRTGESVDSLFKLQRGFTLAGANAGNFALPVACCGTAVVRSRGTITPLPVLAPVVPLVVTAAVVDNVSSAPIHLSVLLS